MCVEVTVVCARESTLLYSKEKDTGRQQKDCAVLAASSIEWQKKRWDGAMKWKEKMRAR